MCGIAGKISFTPQPVERALVQEMCKRILHRGPDEDGYYFSPDNSFGMGIRRLKIIDLSTGSQPLFNETGEIAVILNGEIYNYIELRDELEARGHRFTSHSDTETLAHAYEEYGLDFLSRLNGMFGFALWDGREKKLIVARDRMGIKPLYYRLDSKGFSFGSEIKALLADPECSREIDAAALDDYFSLMYVPGPRSIFQAIKKLEPGHVMICDARTRSVQNQKYWERAPIGPVKDLGWPHYREQLEWLFRDALKLQLRSDVPNGLFLSSGLDSGTIAYFASQTRSRIKSFTIDFADKSYSESAGARAIAQRCGTDHQEITLDPDVRPLVEKIADFYDEPFADSSSLPSFLLYEFARKQITVALSGEGGDELFAGYPTYIATGMAPAYRELPAPARRLIAAAVRRLPVSWNRVTLEYKLKQFVLGAEMQPERSHFAWKEIFTQGAKDELYADQFLSARNGRDGFESFRRIFEGLGNGVELEKLLAVDQQTYLLDQFLVKSDRMSMAHSLEVRVPILDHRLVEFAATVPARYKLRGFTTKWALRELMRGRLPDDVVSGAKKGFSPPLPAWIAGPLRPFVEEVLSEASVRKSGFLRPEIVQRYLREHFDKKRDHHRRLWTLVNFVLWHERWAERSPS